MGRGDEARSAPGSAATRVVTFCVAWHPDGRRVASAGSADGQFTVKVWDATTGTEVFTLPAPGRPEFFAVAFSPDGRYLVTGRGSDGPCDVWDANDGRWIRSLGTHDSPVRGVVFSPDGQSPGYGQRRRGGQTVGRDPLGEKQKPQEPLRTFHAHSPGVGLNVAFSPDGKRLAMSDKEYTVKIWDVETGRGTRWSSGGTTATSTPSPSAPTAGGSPRRARTAP